MPPVLLFVATIAVLSAWSSAWAHDWYPQECCSGKDCAPLDYERVKVTPDGYVVDGVVMVAHGKARVSPDEHYHACFPSSRKILGCFWAPKPAM